MLPPVVEVGGTFGFVESAAVRSGVRRRVCLGSSKWGVNNESINNQLVSL